MEMEIAKVEMRGRNERELVEDIARELADFFTGNPSEFEDYTRGIDVNKLKGKRIVSVDEDSLPESDAEFKTVVESIGETTGTEWAKWRYGEDLAGRYYYALLPAGRA